MGTSDPERVVYRCQASSPWVGITVFGVGSLSLALASGGKAAIAMTALGAIAIGLLASFVPVLVEVGADGVTLARFGRRRFLPYRSIKSVEVREREGTGIPDADDGPTRAWTVHLSVVFTLDTGEHIEVGTGTDEVPATGNHSLGRVGSFGATDPVSRAIVRDVRARLKALQGHTSTPLEHDLERAGRSPGEWLAALRQIAEAKGGTYRVTPTDKEALWSILEDPAAAPSARAGAAVVLRKMLAPEDASRVRVAVERCELPRLRVAVEQTLAGDEASPELEETLARLE